MSGHPAPSSWLPSLEADPLGGIKGTWEQWALGLWSLKGVGAEPGTAGRTAHSEDSPCPPLPRPAQVLEQHRLITLVDPEGPHPHLHLGKASSHHIEMGKLRPRVTQEIRV